MERAEAVIAVGVVVALAALAGGASCGGKVVVDPTPGTGGALSVTSSSLVSTAASAVASTSNASSAGGGSGGSPCNGVPSCAATLGGCPPSPTACLIRYCVNESPGVFCCDLFTVDAGTPCSNDGGTVCDDMGDCMP